MTRSETVPPGKLFVVVGPSGVGKDSLIAGAREALAPAGRFVFGQRVITRAADAGGEDHLAVSEAVFEQMQITGAFFHSWEAHGLRYGLPSALLDELKSGRHVVVNGSRAALPALIETIGDLVVIEVTASPENLRQRIAGRGREVGEQMNRRLDRRVAMPKGVQIVQVANDGTLAQGIAALAGALTSHSESQLQRKMQGGRLDTDGYTRLFADIIAGHYSQDEIAAGLRAMLDRLDDAEITAVARARCGLAETMRWDSPVVVDKHSLGGVPGSRITLIVVPIVAAYGLPMPKTSSRAITSASGTAEAMASIARVDLTADDVRRCVAANGGCIAWNGLLNHSVLDDVINAIARPLALDCNRWSVASILSKKATAGATHVLVDLPYGPSVKLKTKAEADVLGALFTQVGEELGLTMRVLPTDGSRPIGRGIGPALELRDALAVLDNDSDCSKALRDKALRFAGEIIAFAPAVANAAEGRRIAESILLSGEARARFDRIVDTQGRRETMLIPGSITRSVRAPRSGRVTAIDGWRIAGIARRAGAPLDGSAGIDIACQVGADITEDDLLYSIHGSAAFDVDAACMMAEASAGVTI